MTTIPLPILAVETLLPKEVEVNQAVLSERLSNSPKFETVAEVVLESQFLNMHKTIKALGLFMAPIPERVWYNMFAATYNNIVDRIVKQNSL
ncbi:MAG: hypothetical protein V4526_02575 [Patescibacteria group bacterium]